MKKIKKIILTLLVMSFLANPMCLILRVHAANEEIAMSRISDTLQSVMQSSEEAISADIVLTFACDANNNDIAYSIANLDIYLYDVNYELLVLK